MKLVAFTMEGYRRFDERTSVKLHGDLVAFVGPNEAGKSSLLRAMAHPGSNAPFAPDEHPRRTDLKPKLPWQFQIEEDDRAAIADIHGGSAVQRVTITKIGDKRTWKLEPA